MTLSKLLQFVRKLVEKIGGPSTNLTAAPSLDNVNINNTNNEIGKTPISEKLITTASSESSSTNVSIHEGFGMPRR